MKVLNPPKRDRFCDSFRTAANNITGGISASQAVAANGQWTKWVEFCQDVALDPLLISY